MINTIKIVVDANLRLTYVQKGYETLNSQKASVQAIRIMAKILEEIPNHRISDNKTKYEVATELIDSYRILDLVISDLQTYCEKANALWEKGDLKKENIDSVEMLKLPFTHRSNIATRLSFIRQLLNVSLQEIQVA